IAGTCQYAAGTKTVSVRANFAADLGKTVANASNRLFISFKVKIPKTEGSTSYENQGTASWTPPGETDPIDTVTVYVPGVVVKPIDPKDPQVPVVVLPPGVGVNDPSIGRPDPEKPGTAVETPVVVVPDTPPSPPEPPLPPEPPQPPKPPQPPPTITSIPTLSEWGVILLSCLMGLFALRQVSVARRR
nr:IPTL-CTERM sorting domain-containing protein [Giesbergeria sp.]